MPLPANYLQHGGYVVRGTPLQIFATVYQAWTDPLAADPDGIKTTFAGPNATTATYVERVDWDGVLANADGIVIFDYPRTVQIVVTHGAAVVAVNGVISGLDQHGKNVEEAWSVTAGGTSKIFTGNRVFSRVTQVTVISASDASTDSITIGSTDSLGLLAAAYPGGVDSAVKEQVNGAIVITGDIISTGATPEPYGRYEPATAPDGANDYELWYLAQLPDSNQ